MPIPIEIKVNGRQHRLEVPPQTTLLELLRDRLLLTGPKEGCGEGDCGTCMVLMDGQPVNSCLVLAVDAHGAEVTTVEGLVTDQGLHPLQESFMEHGAVQCGFCTPGMIISAEALLRKNPNPSDAQIQEGLSGVLCRCGTYPRIMAAVKAASQPGAPGDGGHED